LRSTRHPRPIPRAPDDPEPLRAPTKPRPRQGTAAWKIVARQIRFCRQYDAALTDWEREFLIGLPQFIRLSEKQVEILNRIHHKCLMAADLQT
jgi:hypothetical protein